MSYASSPMDRASTGFSPVYTASPLFEHMAIPKGKYHPSNFVSPSTSPGPSLRIPSHKHSLPARKQSPRPERHSPDAKRKLQQYQREMIAQARLASLPGTPLGVVSKPESPRLTPMGSPGPITPFELEENAGYLVAGTKSRGASEREVVARLIEAEGERARMVRREVPRSPVLSV